MRGPSDDRLTPKEEVLVARLEREIEERVRAGYPYRFIAGSIGAADFSLIVKAEAVRRARAAGYEASDVDEFGEFEVRPLR